MREQTVPELLGQTLGRFLVVRRIGAGGMGVVYEATDRAHGARVALKTLNHLEPEAIYGLKREFRSLAGVVHPNLVHMHELSCEGPHWFFVMDYVEGLPYLEYLRGPAEPLYSADASTVNVRKERTSELPTMPAALAALQAIDLSSAASAPEAAYPVPSADSPLVRNGYFDKVRSAFAELAQGVLALHLMGKMHGDLKPSNVLVTPGGRVVILDFGLTVDESASQREEVERRPRGTPLYMAPELFLEGQASRPADFYALGVMLYESLVGQAPFVGPPHRLVADKLYGKFLSPRELLPTVPEDLDYLCMEMLHRDPEKRITGNQLAALLRKAAISPVPPIRGSTLPQAPFIGRTEELALLDTAYQGAMLGRANLVRICGESGLGKTALIEAFLAQVRSEPDVLVLSGRCYEHESVPYKAFDQIADALSVYLAHTSDEEVAVLVPQEAEILTMLFPVLARVPAFSQLAREHNPADPTELRLRGFAGLRELLGRLSRLRRLVLVIDDVQWADDDSALVFKEIFAGSNPPSCLTLVTSREEHPPALSTLLEALDSQHEVGTCATQLNLGPLSGDDAQELAQSVAPQVEGVVSSAHFIAEEAKGNPFFILALSRRAQSHGAADSLPSLMQNWLGSLSPASIELLSTVAIAGRPLDESVALAVVGAQDVSQELFSLSSSHFIGAWPTPSRKIECYHDRIREAVLASLDMHQQQRLHGRLGEVLEALGGADAERLSMHFLAAGQSSKGSRYAERAADEASAALAFLQAAHWYGQALQSGFEHSERRAQLTAKIGEAYAGAGRGAKAASFLLQAASASPSQEASLKLKQRAAELLLASGHIDQGVKTLDEVLRHTRMKLAKTPRRALMSLVYQRARVKLRGLSYTPRTPGETPQSQLLKIDSCWSVALGLSLVDPIRAADFQTRNLLLSLECGDSYRVARALAMEAGFLATGGTRSEVAAMELSKRARELAEEIKCPHAIGLSHFTAGLGQYLRGNWKEACVLLLQAEKLLVNVPGAIWELNASQRFYLNALTFIGDLKGIAARSPELVKSAKERGNLYAECALRVRMSSLMWLMRDDHFSAAEETQEVMKRWSQDGFQLQHYSEFCAQIQCDIYRGDVEKALERARATWPKIKASLLTNTQALRIESAHMRTRIALAYLAEHPDHKESQAMVKEDVRNLRKEKAGWGDAYAHLAEALSRVQTSPELAQAGLLMAKEGFEKSNMLLLARVSDYRRGQLMGGEEGALLIAEGLEFLKHQGVVNPERFAHHCAPAPFGFG